MRAGKHEITALAVTLALIAGSFAASLHIRKPEALTHLRCAIELGEACDTTPGLLTGYNYHLLERFAADNGQALDISLSRRGDSYLDSLKRGVVDIVAVPCGTVPADDSLDVSIPVDSISLWIVPSKSGALLKSINRWLDKYHKSDTYIPTRTAFLQTYDPLKKARAGRKTPVLSPYDSIITRYADTLGWDWKILEAVVYQESRFRIDARSHRGAIGLMQMMPYTAGKWCDGDLVNPERSIRAGTMYLKSLSGRYTGISSIPEERVKFTLAAYNAGEGRIKDVINYARLNGVSTEYWDSVVTVIPGMRDTLAMSRTDTVKLGVFQGFETINYVDRVMSLYEAFNEIYIPEK